MKSALTFISRKLSLRAQLIAIILITSIITFSIAGTILFINESKHSRAELSEELTALASLVGDRSSAALTFFDNKTATENLNSLSGLDQIGTACLFNDHGELFAQYKRDEVEKINCAIHEPLAQTYAAFIGETLRVQVPVVSKNELIGAIQINSTRSPLIHRFSDQILSLGLALGGALVIAIFLAIRLQTVISKPLAQVRDVANAIMESKNYALRAPKLGHNETGELARAFNSMLSTIEEQNIVLAERESYSKQLFYDSPIPQLISDPATTTYLDCNQAAAEIYGYASREELIGKSMNDVIAPVQGGGPASSDINVNHYFSDDSGLVNVNGIRYQRRDGTLWDGLVTHILFQRNGRSFLHICVEDITYRKQAEQQLKQSNDELEERVSKRTSELAKTNRNLETAHAELKRTQAELIQREKMASLGALIAGVSHEMNTPLGNSLTVSTYMMNELIKFEDELANSKLTKSRLKEFNEQLHSGLDLLQRSLDRAIEQVAHFKQVSVDQTSDQRRVFDLGAIISGNIAILDPQFKHTPHRIVVDIAPGYMVDSYPGAVGQVITNLVLNSLIHGFSSEVQGVVAISAQSGGNQNVILTVADNGKGIPKKNLHRVFDPFFTTRMGQGGSGLGLNIVFNIVTSTLGGSVEVSSEEGVRTVFTISLPLVAP